MKYLSKASLIACLGLTPVLGGFAFAALMPHAKKPLTIKLNPPATPNYWPRDIVIGQEVVPPGEACACDGEDVTGPVTISPIPTGITFTGNCTPYGCSFVPSGSGSTTINVTVPAGYCLAELKFHMRTNAPIVVCTENSHCPTGTYPATSYYAEIVRLVPCEDVSPDPGEGTGGGLAEACGCSTK